MRVAAWGAISFPGADPLCHQLSEILDKAIYDSLYANAPKKSMNLSLFPSPPNYELIVGQFGFHSLV